MRKRFVKNYFSFAMPAIAIVLFGCSAAQNPNMPATAATPPPPLKLCPPEDVPPPDVARKPGYDQFSVLVADASGASVDNLKASDLTARAGPNPVPIVFFQPHAAGSPMSLIIVMDASGSMHKKLVTEMTRAQAVQQALARAIGQLNPCDEIAALSFGGENPGGPIQPVAKITVVQPFTTDRQLALSHLADREPYGDTPLYDAIAGALQLSASAHYSTRAIIVMTDGIDNASTLSKDALIDEIKNSGVPIYVVGIGDPNPPPNLTTRLGLTTASDLDRVDKKVLDEIARSSGGRSFIVSPVNADAGSTLIATVSNLAPTLGQGYTIGVIRNPAITTASLTPAAIVLELVNRPDDRVIARAATALTPAAPIGKSTNAVSHTSATTLIPPDKSNDVECLYPALCWERKSGKFIRGN